MGKITSYILLSFENIGVSAIFLVSLATYFGPKKDVIYLVINIVS